MMPISKLNIFLLLVFVVTIIGNWTLGRDYSQPNWEMIPEMVHSVPYDPYAPNPNFADGMTLRKPVANTIARGQLPLLFGPSPLDAALAGERLQNPLHLLPYRAQLSGFLSSSSGALQALPFLSHQVTAVLAHERKAEALKRGAHIYGNYCQLCHGATGDGKGPVTNYGVPSKSLLGARPNRISIVNCAVSIAGMLGVSEGKTLLPAAASVYPGRVGEAKDGELFHVITYGQGNMASYAAQLSREQRWQVILHIRSLQQKAAQTQGGG